MDFNCGRMLYSLPRYSGGGSGWGFCDERAKPPLQPSRGVPGEGEGGIRRERHLYSRSTLAVPSAATVIACVNSPNRSCHATSVYEPGGTSTILNVPSSLLTAKHGLSKTPTKTL